MSANRTQQKADEGKVIEGLQKYAASIPSLIVQNQTVTVAQAIAILQARINAITAAQTAKIAWIDAVQQQDKELASTDTFVVSLVTVIRGMYAGAPSTLADFGQVPRKVTPLTAEQKAAANLKRAATRAARHTMGAKQKAAIKGTVPAAPAATPAPSSATTPGAAPAGVAGGGTPTPHA